MKTMACIFGLVMVLGLAVVGLGQGVVPGYDAASFARFGLGTRALGMAGAYVALGEGPAAGYWNPAGLISLSDFQLEGMYTDWQGVGVYYQYLSAAGYPPLGEERPGLSFLGYPLAFGLTWLSVDIPDIPWWEEEGSAPTLSAWLSMGILSVALPLSQSPSLAIGANVKVYHDRILEDQSLGFGYDVGLLWRAQVADVPIRVGICTTDLGSTVVQWTGPTAQNETYVPWLMHVGGAAEFWEGRLLLTTTYEWGVERPRFERLRVGGEARLGPLSLRAGWDQPLWLDPSLDPGHEPERVPGQWTAGVGIGPWDWMALEYAFLPGRFGDTHFIALRLAF